MTYFQAESKSKMTGIPVLYFSYYLFYHLLMLEPVFFIMWEVIDISLSPHMEEWVNVYIYKYI